MERNEFLNMIRKHGELIRKKEEEMNKASLLLIESYFEKFFQRNKDVYSVGWIQYTPYFNDGDICNFYVHSDNIYINEEEDSEDFNLQIEEIRVFLYEIPDTIMKSLFGEGNVIFSIVNNELTFRVDDYDHH